MLVDANDHSTTPEVENYEIILHFATEHAEKYKCKQWSEDDFATLGSIARQSDFHYFVRSFYQKSMMMNRDNCTFIHYIGGIHDGETLRMEGSPAGLTKLSDLIGRVNRQDGSGVDIYRPKINGDVLEFHFDRTERN